MPAPQEKPIVLKSGEFTPQRGIWHEVGYSSRERTTRALVMWLGCWAAAVAVFLTLIPLIHLLGALSLLVAGPLGAYRRFNAFATARGAEGICPACNQAVVVAVEKYATLPMWTYCPSCRAPLHLHDAASMGGVHDNG